jgi:hypothetical protein
VAVQVNKFVRGAARLLSSLEAPKFAVNASECQCDTASPVGFAQTAVSSAGRRTAASLRRAGVTRARVSRARPLATVPVEP